MLVVNTFFFFLGRMYKLQRIINIEKRLDYVKGSRYFLELELSDRSNRVLRFSQYVFAPNWTGLTQEEREQERKMRNMMWGPRRRLMASEKLPELCWPTGLAWNPRAMVYVIVPGELVNINAFCDLNVRQHFFC